MQRGTPPRTAHGPVGPLPVAFGPCARPCRSPPCSPSPRPAQRGCGSSSATKIEGPTHELEEHLGFAGAALSRRGRRSRSRSTTPTGTPVTLAGQRGRYVLVTFLYTHCPDVCPLIAANLNAALRTLGAGTKHVRVLAVSVDPKGDTAAAVRAYRTRMHLLPQFRYLIGTRAELAASGSPGTS